MHCRIVSHDSHLSLSLVKCLFYCIFIRLCVKLHFFAIQVRLKIMEDDELGSSGCAAPFRSRTKQRCGLPLASIAVPGLTHLAPLRLSLVTESNALAQGSDLSRPNSSADERRCTVSVACCG